MVIATTGDTTGLELSTTKTRVLKFNPERIKIVEDNTVIDPNHLDKKRSLTRKNNIKRSKEIALVAVRR